MSTSQVRIRPEDKAILDEYAKEFGLSLTAALSEILKQYRKQRFFKQVSTDYARLKEDPKEWKEFQDEMELLDDTLMDGLDEDEDFSKAFPE